jgi:hypothetical protein
VVTLVAFKFLLAWISRYDLELTFCPTFWTFAVYSFSGQVTNIQRTVY